MHRSILTLLAGSLLATAQEPPVPVPPQPGGAQPAVAGQPADPNTVINEDVVLPGITGENLAELYRKYTGRRVTVSVAASQAQFNFIQPAPLTYGEAAELIKKAALLEGFVFIADPLIENHDLLVFSGAAGTGPGPEAIPTIVDAGDLPDDDRVVTYVMNLRYIKPDELVRTFTTVIGQLTPGYGTITPVPNAGSVIITEKTSLIKRLIEIKDQVDVSAPVSTKFIKVQFADVQELADTLNEVLNTQQQSQQSAGLNRVQAGNNAPNTPNIPGGPAAAGAAGVGSAAEEVPIQIVADTRTNRIFAMGRPVDIVFIEGLVAEFDTQTDSRNYLRRKLRFVKVADFLEIAEPALQRAFSGQTDGTTGGRSTGANFGNNRNTTNNRTTATNRSSAFGGSGSGRAEGLTQTGGGGNFASSGLADPNINSAPEARLVGRTLLVADNITNSLVVQGPPASVEIIENLLDQVDVKAEQVMISAVFGQLNLSEEFEFGVDYLRTLDSGDSGATAGRGGSGQFPVLPLDGTDFNPGALSGAGLSLYGMIGDHWNIVLNALENDSNFKVLSRPTIYTSNNRKGTISAGQRIAVPTSTYQGGVNTGISTNVEYQNVFLTLEVVPLVNSDDEITLEIYLVNEELGEDRIIDADLVIPDILSRQILTSVTVPDGSTIALGGLINTQLRDSVSGIPLLSDIPGLGKLFSSTSNEEIRQELMIFIQPRIVDNAMSLYDAQLEFDSRFSMAEETRAFSQGPAVVPQAEGVRPASDKGGARQPVAAPARDDEPSGPVRRGFGRPGSPFRR